MLIVGGGVSGLAAALAAGRAGARVILADEDFLPGGRLNSETYEVGGQSGSDWAAASTGELAYKPVLQTTVRPPIPTFRVSTDRCQFRATLLAFNDVLYFELFRAGKSFEQFNGQLRQLARRIAFEVINRFDIRVDFAVVLVLLVVVVPLLFFVGVFVWFLVRMSLMLLVEQLGGDVRCFQPATRVVIEREEPVAVFQRGDRLVQGGVVGLG